MSECALVWFRRDLRLADNPALAAAVERGYRTIVPVYVHAPDELGDWPPGGAQRVWLNDALVALSDDLAALGSRLIVRRDASLPALESLIDETGATAVFWNRLYDPAEIARDVQIKRRLCARENLTVESFRAHLLFEPWEVQTGQGQPYKVFTPFWRRVRNAAMPAPVARPDALPAVADTLASASIDSLGLAPALDWPDKIRAHGTPGEQGAHRALEGFLERALARYDTDRDHPAVSGTSRLSAHLHFGEISPAQIMHRTREWQHEHGSAGCESHVASFQSEIGWREFAHHVLYHFPTTPDTPLDRRFEAFPWADDDAALRAWKTGQTGIPMVDAGMRELWATGIMHNRLRMTVASFLTKNLRIAWQHGERWFWDTLVDADLASNTLGWQWATGCGADAAPFFRIFNPARQGERFDADGEYVRRWVPELARLPNRHIHAPWAAPSGVLAASGVTLGKTYPAPIIDLKQSRREALAAFEQIKN